MPAPPQPALGRTFAGKTPLRSGKSATGDVGRPEAAAPPQTRVKLLPEWPIYVFFCGFPLWWVLGLSAFATGLMVVPLGLLLIRYRSVQIPRAFLWWLGFLLCVFASSVMLDNPGRVIGYLVRVSAYLGTSLLFLYIYNSRIPTRRIVFAVVAFAAFVAFGGWLGVVAPNGSFPTPTEKLLPASIGANDYVKNMTHPRFAEVQDPWGASSAFARPSAPFPYTNSWGVNFALLLPFALAGFSLLETRRAKLLLGVGLAASLVPAFATLNRGLFLAAGIGLTYASLRLAARGHIKPLVGLLTVTAVGGWVAWAAGVFARIQERTTVSSTTADRQALYKETFERSLQSPLFGWGAPRPSETMNISVGTQGHVWNLMFSYGFIALLCFAAFIWWSVWRSRAIPTPALMWLHVSLFVAGFAFLIYGFDGPQMALTMVSAAVVLRAASPPAPAVELLRPGSGRSA